MKIKKKIIIFLLVMLLLLFIYNKNVFATDSIIQGAEDFLDKGTETVLDTQSIKNVARMLFNIFSAAGVTIVLIVGVILGIQFILGSTEEKAKVKEALIPYGIGSAVVFGAVGIWTIATNVIQGIF